MDLNNFYEGDKFFSENCWETCDGHCCKLHRFTKNLQFAPKDSMVLHLYPFEYDWLIANKELDPEFEKTLITHEYEVDGLKLRYHSVYCGYDGLCPNHKFRPISCFLFPYLPTFSKEGKAEKLYNLSLYDDIYSYLDLENPCTLRPKFNNLEQYQELVDKYLDSKEFFFYTNVYVRIKEVAVTNYKNEVEPDELEKTLGHFEMLMALKKLVPQEVAHKIIKEEAARFNITSLS